MKNLILKVIAFVLVATIICIVPLQAQWERLGGFTPNAEITLSFPKSTYPAGATAPAKVTITGPKNGTYPVTITDSTGQLVDSFGLEIGGATGSNETHRNIVLPAELGKITYTASFTIKGKTPAEDKSDSDAATLDIVAARTWEATPAIVVGELDANDEKVKEGQSVTIKLEASDEDTWTNADGTTGKERDLDLRYTWSSGAGTIKSGQGSAEIVWIAPDESSVDGLPVTISCVVDDSLSVGETGVTKPDAGTRNDAPATIKTVSVTVFPKPCGEWKHQSWEETSAILWSDSGSGIPFPIVEPAWEHSVWKDDCAATTKAPKREFRSYREVQRQTVNEGGQLFLEVTFQAFSKYGGPNTALLKGRKQINRVWKTGSVVSGAGSMVSPAAGGVVQAGETVAVSVEAASDSDTWTRGSASQNVSDGVKYTWSSDIGSFLGTPDGPTAVWTAPAEVPAGAQGVAATITCKTDDDWNTGQTGVNAPDTGNRNDSGGPTASVAVQVVRQACGRWQHKSWGEDGALEWRTDSNGDPEPIDPDPIVETLKWEDSCAATTKADKTQNATYQKTKDVAVEDEGVWYRAVEYQAFSAAPNGPAAPTLSGRAALPRHWTTPGELDGGDLQVTVSGAPDQGEIAPTKPGQAVVATVPYGASVGASFAISAARDTDTYSYWHVPEKSSDDTLRYKWTMSGGPEEAPIDEVDLGTGSSAALPNQPALKPGTYTVSCEVDDASSGQESGVAAPDLGNRNDGSKTHTIIVRVVSTDWSPLDKGIGFHPATDENDKRIEPIQWVEDGKIKLPAPDSETKAVPGEAIELEVNEAQDWDSWKQSGIGQGIADDEPLTYTWTATGGKFRVAGENGAFDEVETVSGLKATWLAPAPDENAPEGQNQSHTITCTIDDGTLPRIDPDGETGSHDDAALVRTVSVEVVPSYWSPEDKGIGYHPTLDETTRQPVKPYQWNEDGRIIAPLDQRLEDAPDEKVVVPGESVTATIEEAQDWDTLTTLEGKSIERDTALTYTWSSGEVGHFLVKDADGNPVLDADGEPTTAATATGLSVTWVAPDDIEEDTDVDLICTVDDGEGGLVVAPVAGTRDDKKLERVVKVKVVLPKVEFKGELFNDTVRASAGGVDDHAATDPNPNELERNHSQYRAHTRKLDLTLTLKDEPLPNTKFSLSFENNKGHAEFGDGKKKTARLHKQEPSNAAWTDWTETLEVTTDSQGKVSVWVLSSDVINQPTLQATLVPKPDQEPVVIGEIECDFAPSISYRNFIPKNAAGEPIGDPDEKDTGWVFNFPHLVDENNNTGMTPAKVYLKFTKDGNDDKPVDGQLQFVNGHEVRISIHSVDVFNEETGEIETIEGTPQELKRYAFVVLNESGPTSPDEVTATRTTTAKGETAPNVFVFGGPDLDQVSIIYVQLEDLTEHKE